MAVSSDLWKILNSIRCKMDVAQFRKYVMPFMFYSAANYKVEQLMKEELENDGLTYREAWNHKDEDTGEYDYREELREVQLENFGFVIEPDYSLMQIVPAVLQGGESFIDLITEAVENFDENCDEKFRGTLSMLNFDDDMLGDDPDEINDLIFNKLFKPTYIAVINAMKIKEAEPGRHEHEDILGQFYMEIMSHFAEKGGKGGGEFFTPIFMSDLVAKLATYGVENAESIYDPTCGSGSLLIKAAHEIHDKVNAAGYPGEVGHYYGQDINLVNVKQAKMNMCMYDIKAGDFDIYCTDTLGRVDLMSDKTFDVIVANPPYSVSWDNTDRQEDPRFSGYGAYAPAKTADLAFLQHIVYHMAEGGRAAVLLPRGVLFRGNAEKTIRQTLIDNHNCIDAIIELPSNCFYGASIPVVCIVLREDRNGDSEDICFIDASRYFKTAGGKNYITDEDIDRIMQAYAKRENIDHFCSIVSIDKIKENDYNLSIPLYVEAPKDETEHDLGELFQDYRNLEGKAEELKLSINEQLASFGIEQRFNCLKCNN